jgi:hypothetical protein
MTSSTPGSELANQLQQVLNKNPGPVKIKVQEQGGVKVKTKLQKSNPNKTKGCGSNWGIIGALSEHNRAKFGI